jgi:hypothetical protein
MSDWVEARTHILAWLVRIARCPLYPGALNTANGLNVTGDERRTRTRTAASIAVGNSLPNGNILPQSDRNALGNDPRQRPAIVRDPDLDRVR